MEKFINERASNGTWNLTQRFQCTFQNHCRFFSTVAIFGAVYIYERASNGTWNLAQRIEGSQPEGRLGSYVEISNAHAIVGEYNNDVAVYAYRCDINGVWEFSQKLGFMSTVNYGTSVAISNGYILIGSGLNQAYYYDGTNGSCECF